MNFINMNTDITTSSEDNITREESLSPHVAKVEMKQDLSEDVFPFKKGAKKSACTENISDEKDLLIAQLQEQIAKQRECISQYESIVQLMNYKLMKLKKVLKAHRLLGELD
ncbi:hypothetical protein KM043_018688 [Ampulex compressa]|nr:hypothetical protein KM043_018688 [Ampulex compressa]